MEYIFRGARGICSWFFSSRYPAPGTPPAGSASRFSVQFPTRTHNRKHSRSGGWFFRASFTQVDTGGVSGVKTGTFLTFINRERDYCSWQSVLNTIMGKKLPVISIPRNRARTGNAMRRMPGTTMRPTRSRTRRTSPSTKLPVRPGIIPIPNRKATNSMPTTVPTRTGPVPER
jgi:hypothetical protein